MVINSFYIFKISIEFRLAFLCTVQQGDINGKLILS